MKDIKDLKKLYISKKETKASEYIDEMDVASQTAQDDIKELTNESNKLKNDVNLLQAKLKDIVKDRGIEVIIKLGKTPNGTKGKMLSLKIDGKKTSFIHISEDIENEIKSNKDLPQDLQYIKYFYDDYINKRTVLKELKRNAAVFQYMYWLDAMSEYAIERGLSTKVVTRRFNKAQKKLYKEHSEVREFVEYNNYLDDNYFAWEAISEMYEKKYAIEKEIADKKESISKLNYEILQKQKHAKYVNGLISKCDAGIDTSPAKKEQEDCMEL